MLVRPLTIFGWLVIAGVSATPIRSAWAESADAGSTDASPGQGDASSPRIDATGTASAAATAAAAPRSTAAVTGRVIDTNGHPALGATVRVLETGVVATTDKRGHFTIKLPPEGRFTLEVSKPPFESSSDTVTMVVGKAAAPIDLLLIDEVATVAVVEVAKRESPAPGSTQIAREEITRIPGTRGDVLTAIQSLPGVANTGTFTPFSGGIVIRGSAPADSRVLVDGFEVPLLFHFGAVQSILPSEMIEDVVYAPGGFGVEQGRASAGTISVNTRRGQPKASGFAEVSFINGGLFLQGPIGKQTNHATFAFSVRRSLIDAILPAVLPPDSGLGFTLLPRYYDWQARADWQPRDRWRLSMFVFSTDDGTSFALSKDNATDPALSGTFKSDTTFTRGIVSATYESPRVQNRLSLTADTTKFDFQTSADRYLLVKFSGIGVRDEARARVAGPLTLRAGGEAFRHNVTLNLKFPRPPREGDPMDPSFTFDPPVIKNESYVLSNVAAWTSADLELGSRAMLSAGGRYDGFLRNDAHVFQPRGELKLNAGKNILRTAGGLYTRPPQWQDENGQKDLGAEKAWQLTSGIERELRPRLTLQTTGFYTWRSNLIVFATDRRDAMTANNAYANRGTGKTFGAEALLTWRGDSHFAWIAYTLSRSVRSDGPSSPERLFDFDQTHNLIVLGSKRFGQDKHWQIGGRFQLTTGKPYTPVDHAVFVSDLNYYRAVFGALNSVRTETLHQLDVRVDRSWRFAHWKLSAFLDIQNIYAHAAVIAYQYSYDFSQKEPFRTLPFLPSFGIRGEF